MLFEGGCLEVIPTLGDGKIDMLLCDLPYGLSSRNKWDIRLPLDRLWEQWLRVVKEDGAIVLTATEPFTSLLVMSQPKLFKYDLIWEKPLATGFLNANRMPLRSHEQVLVFYRRAPTYNPQKTPGKPYRLTRRSDTSNYKEVRDLHHETVNESGDRHPKSVLRFAADRKKLHPTQKPVALFEWLVRTYTEPGQVVLDPCAGSGTTGVACQEAGRRWVLVEQEPKYCQIAAERLGGGVEIRRLGVSER